MNESNSNLAQNRAHTEVMASINAGAKKNASPVKATRSPRFDFVPVKTRVTVDILAGDSISHRHDV